MATPSLNDLLTVPSQDEVLDQEVLPELKKRKIRVTDWLVGAVERANAYVIAKLRMLSRASIAALTAAGFEDYVFGFSTPPPGPDGESVDVTGWAGFVAEQRYGIKQIDASSTKRTITLTNATATTYGPLQPGAIIVQFPSGNRYVLDEVTTISPSADTDAVFRSEFASDSAAGLVYNDPSDSTISLVTAKYPGVTASNPAPTFSPVSQAGTGLGTVTPSGTPVGDHAFAIRIVNAGNVSGSTAVWQYSVDGGSWSADQNTYVVVVGYGVTVTLADNGGNPAFELNAVYYFQAPGTDIVQAGADIETPQQLGTRCRGILPSLAFVKDSLGNWIPISPTASAYETLARSANDQIRVVLVETDDTVNNQINVVIAGQGGTPLGPGVVANVQLFFDSFTMLTDRPAVSTSTARTITLAGLTVTTKSSQQASAQTLLTKRLQTYLGGVDPDAALSINGRIDYDYIISLVRTTPGVTKVSGTLLINGAAADLQLPVTPGAYESAKWTDTSVTSFAWETAL
jgi:hypothetical protein